MMKAAAAALPKQSKYEVGIVGAGPVGLFLSKLLNNYGINHCIVDKKLRPTSHPQAHFINNRTMELFQACVPSVFDGILKGMSESSNWRCTSMTSANLQYVSVPIIIVYAGNSHIATR